MEIPTYLEPVSFWNISHHLRHGYSANRLYRKICSEACETDLERTEQKQFKYYSSPGTLKRYKVFFVTAVVGLSTCEL